MDDLLLTIYLYSIIITISIIIIMTIIIIINIIITTSLILFVLSLALLNTLTISGWLDRWDESISINAVSGSPKSQQRSWNLWIHLLNAAI